MAANTNATNAPKTAAAPRKRAPRKAVSKAVTAPATAGVSLDRKMTRNAQRNTVELARTGNTDAAKKYWNNALRAAGVLGKDAPNLRSI